MGKKGKGGKGKKGGGGANKYTNVDDDLDDSVGRGGRGRHNHNQRGGQQGNKGGKRRKKPRGGKFGTQMHDDDAFRRNLLSNDSFSINEMAADGNCLFRSLSDQLYGDYGNKHDMIRKDVCEFLRKNEEEFAVFLLLDEHDEDVSDFDTYLEKMMEDGEWGGNVELVAAARFYQRTITVFSPTGAFSIESGHDDESGDKLLLSYHDNGHYNSVRDDSRKLTPPSKISDRATQNGNVGERKKKGKRQNVGNDEKKEERDAELNARSTTSCSPEPENDNHKEEDGENSDTCKKNIRDKEMKKKQVIVRKNDPCPCGSNLRYKKCCLATEKSKARVEKWKAKHGGHGGGDDSKESDDERDDEHDENLDGTFRVLKI